MLRRALLSFILAGLGGFGLASAQPANRFPQPVRVGDLLHRQVLRPVEQQNVIGRVASVVRRDDGQVLFVIDLGGTFSLGTRPVAVPAEAMVLLGEYVAVADLTPDQLRALPPFDPTGTTALPADTNIKVGLARPFH